MIKLRESFYPAKAAEKPAANEAPSSASDHSWIWADTCGRLQCAQPPRSAFCKQASHIIQQASTSCGGRRQGSAGSRDLLAPSGLPRADWQSS